MQLLKLWVGVQFVLAVSADCSHHCKAYDCPCDCIKNKIRCWDRNVTTILNFPTHSLYDEADFGNNQIQSLQKVHLQQRSWRNLDVLQLSANLITDIEEHCFVGLHHLTSLFLNSNKIGKLSEEAFSGLKKLKRLYLNNNQIETLPKDLFKPLRKSLQLLYLQENRIRFIEKRTFDHFHQLRTLDISRNKLTTLDTRFLHSSKTIIHLFMGENLWHCDQNSVCSTLGVIVKERKKTDRDGLNLHQQLICSTPEKFQFEDMKTVIGNYDCDKENHSMSFSVTVINNKDNSAPKKQSVIIISFLCMILLFLFSGLINYL